MPVVIIVIMKYNSLLGILEGQVSMAIPHSCNNYDGNCYGDDEDNDNHSHHCSCDGCTVAGFSGGSFTLSLTVLLCSEGDVCRWS